MCNTNTAPVFPVMFGVFCFSHRACDHDHFSQSRSVDAWLSICICVIAWCPLPSTIRHYHLLTLTPFFWKPYWREPKAGKHKAGHLGDRYLSCQAGDDYGNPPIAGIPPQEFLLVWAKAPGPKQQNSQKHKEIYLSHADTLTQSELFLRMSEYISQIKSNKTWPSSWMWHDNMMSCMMSSHKMSQLIYQT